MGKNNLFQILPESRRKKINILKKYILEKILIGLTEPITIKIPIEGDITAFQWTVNAISKEYENLRLEINVDQEHLYIQSRKFQTDEYYLWIEQSNLSGKFLIIAKPPGAKLARCLSVWDSYEKALEIADKIYPMVLNFSPIGWDNNIKKILDAIPEDDDTAITIPHQAREMFVNSILEENIENMNAIVREHGTVIK
ncbi:MAG: hypothetical protein SWX82_32695 [Cyanobacteriota bacterium]|nr:hypothetical protein [Cyanobacteriota bacterium]